jgi:curved DNA-binding protein CbpA
MSKIEINFNTLKYNLYEILNVPQDADESKIKKSFMKMVKNFHPDKNSELEEEIYHHIILSNQILLNKESRKKYDNFLVDRANTFVELKESFNKNIKELDNLFPEKTVSKQSFQRQVDELNRMHGYNEENNNLSIVEKFNKAKGNRDSKDIKIEYENIKSTNDFNSMFDMNKNDKTDSSKFKGQLVEYTGPVNELSTYVIGEQFANIADIGKLYIEDSVQTNKYSSLDRAFAIQSINTNDVTNKSFEERIKEYKSQSETIKNMKPAEFTNQKYDEL